MRLFSLLITGVFLSLLVSGSVSAKTYSDVSGSYKHQTAISSLSDLGIISGYENGEFHPEDLINRAEAVKILVKTRFDADTIDTALDWHWEERHRYVMFPDVSIHKWYGSYVEVAFKNNIVKGYEDGNFRPASSINFAEALKLILETYGISPSEASFSPNKLLYIDKGEWFEPYFTYANEYNLINQNKFYHPAQLITRGEFVEIMYRVEEIQRTGLPEFISESTASSNEYKITIPKLNIVNLDVNFADTRDQEQALSLLNEGLGHYLAPPSAGKKMILFGHSSGYSWDTSPYKTLLRQINTLNNGDRIYLNYHEKGYVYEIFKSDIIDAQLDYTLLENQDNNELALYTCWPPNSIAQRYVVYGKPV